MRCVVLSASGDMEWVLALEELGVDWHCTVCRSAEQARRLSEKEGAGVMVLCGGAESEVLCRVLEEYPLLTPPYLLGDGFDAPDGKLPPLPQLPERLEHWAREGRLPALALLRYEEAACLARGLLHALAISPRLRAMQFLPDMAALTALHPPLLTDLQHRLYPLVARRHGLTAGAVERSLRLCVESTWSRGRLSALERFFGHSVDPEKGKPTNREFLCRIQERVTLAAGRLERKKT
ncbi:MAG: sporulation initiation factor Spo0A C-terminal domain-containing protein [Clostridia bacterium]|nr:sporulation initiation factor Spo0A C-terminal domain-containing protein [Clostridia bacterium]